MYRPYLVTWQERQVFQLSGDRVAVKIRAHEKLGVEDREVYWRESMKKELAKISMN